MFDPLQGQGDALPAADAQRHQTAANFVALHRVQEPRRQHRACCANRMPVRYRTAFHIDDLLSEAELSCQGDCDCCKSFIDFDAF